MKNLVLYILFLGMLVTSCVDKGNNNANDESQGINESDKIEQLDAEIKADTSNADLYGQRAEAYLELRNYNMAMRDMLTAIQLEPGKTSYLLTLSDIYLSMGLLENCVESLNKVLELEPENTESILKLAEIHLILKQYKEALETTDKAIKIDKLNPLPYFIKAYTFAEAGDTLNAIKNYLEVIDKDQRNYDAYIQLGLIYSRTGNPIAVDYLNNALKIDTESVEAMYAIAMFFQSQGDSDNAIAMYNRLLLIEPDNLYANYNLGYVNLVLLSDYETALGFFEKAIELQPNYFQAIYNLGYCNELLGEYATARNLYNAALEIEVNYDKAIEGLNRIYGK